MHNVMTKYGYGNLEIIQMQYGMQEGKMKKRLASIVLATVTMLTACGGNTSTASGTDTQVEKSQTIEQTSGKKNNYTLLTGSSGAQYFTFGTAMANEINNKSEKINITALTANGVSEVLNMVQTNEADFGFASFDTGYLAATNQRELKVEQIR